MINAIKSGRVDMISHPGNPAFPIDIQAVVKAAAEYRVALELNNSSFSHSRPGSEGNCRAIVEAARDMGAYLTFGSDSTWPSASGISSTATGWSPKPASRQSGSWHAPPCAARFSRKPRPGPYSGVRRPLTLAVTP